MSQKKEKYARNLVRRMDLLEARMGDIQSPTPDRRLSAARRRAARAERNAAVWRVAAIAAALCAIVSAIVALVAVQPSARAAKPEPAAPLTVQVLAVPESPEDPPANREAQLMPWANKIEDCLVTHYDTCMECCGKTDGITASGAQATPGVTVAVDPAVIPLGGDVLVDYGDGLLRQYRAEDVGGTVKGAHVDICVASHEEAVELGRGTATVYWMAPEEGIT